ncbi:hypothetical protein CBR_g36449 [Chara braunii]|uniref:Mitochondrial Rho GTPase n=1 Tax=Chara braunii TaxID=69332 RepID=A0A388LL20_CHABU|nr:hypothetical protein CBR_g36449 [Chara braunii]|eukprot:GBG82922.1 hypothetical protein CBR_g36449 [Chara braunii]
MSRPPVRIVVIGDKGTGKSSLIVAAATEEFPEKTPPVIPPARLPPDLFPDKEAMLVVDTSSRPEDRKTLEEEILKAEAILLTYACDNQSSFDRLHAWWLPELRRLHVSVPIILVGCKSDLRNDSQPGPDQMLQPIMHEHREIDSCMECSAQKIHGVMDVFHQAEKSVLHPIGPLFDQRKLCLKPACVHALKRIFRLCDTDRDDVLDDIELNNFQMKCFDAPLQPAELEGVKSVVFDKMPAGVSDRGLNLAGFLYLHALFIEKARQETTWTVLRTFGYGNDLRLRDELLENPSFKRAPDQSVELTPVAMEFLKQMFLLHDDDGDNALNRDELEELFSTSPANPWASDPRYTDSAEVNVPMGALTMDGFLAQWAMMTLLDPRAALAHLIYLTYPQDPATAFVVTDRRRGDRKRKQTKRNVFQCFVFGAEKAGKSALLDRLLGKQFEAGHVRTASDRYATNVVECENVGEEGGKGTKVLVMREIPDDRAKKVLEDVNEMAACDVAAFVYDTSSRTSSHRALELLEKLAEHGEATWNEVPAILVANKDDLDPDSVAIGATAKVCLDMGLANPIPISLKLGDTANVFQQIIEVAMKPHLSIPITEKGKVHKRYKHMCTQAVYATAVGMTVLAAGYIVYRVYTSRKQQ